MARNMVMLACLIGLLVCNVTGAEAVQYMIQVLGTLPGGNWSEAVGINNSGQVVCDTVDSYLNYHGSVWRNGVVQTIGVSGRACAINDAGQVRREPSASGRTGP